MDYFKGFLSFALIALEISISPSYGFASDQLCASLYDTNDFAGETFSVTDGYQYTNLEEEYVSSDAAWNVTSSVRVKSGCIFTGCNESYFNGECRQFTEDFTRLPEPFENILSANCTCLQSCKCQDFYNIRKNSCARAYVLDGGCNTCHPFYTDLKEGDSDAFPADFETKVSSLMVRPGCQLTVYEDEAMAGKEESVEGIIGNWTEPVRSYSCSCGESPDTAPTEPTPRPSHYPPLINIPATLDEISAMMKGEYGRHPGLMAALQSNRGKRSTKNAYILLLGSSGAGKSSSINFLFDNPNVTRVGADKSITKDIHEFRIPVSVDELGIQNSELRVIDTPGLGDTEGLDKDARFLATLEEYLDGHEDLKNRIPNIVLIFHKFGDNRFAGAASQYVKIIRAIDYFRDRLTDSKYSNVIFVFSHFTAETRSVTRKPDRKLNSLKNVIQEYSKFPRPIILAVAENKPAEEYLPMINGYYKLPNGDFYPKNLFDKITQVTRGGGDAIGEAVIRSAFRNPDGFNVSTFDFPPVDQTNSKVPKYFGILSAAVFQVEKTEVSEKLREAHEKMSPDLKKRFPDSLYYLQKSLNLARFHTAADMPKTTTGIVKLITDLRQNDAVLYLLKTAFDISPPVLKENVLTGYSYDIFKDHPLPVSPFDLGELENSDIGYKFPSMITCNVDTQNTDILHFFNTRSEYLDERLRSLNTGGQISLENFKGAIKSGHNIKDEITTPDGNLIAPVTAVREIRSFELILNDKFTLTTEFKKAVKSLTPYNGSDYGSVDQWKAFFNEYGTHVVKSVYGGGAIEIELNTNKTFSSEISRVLVSFVQFAEDISLGINTVDNSSINHKDIQHTLKFVGGNKAYHTSDLTKLPLQDASDLLEKWKESLILSPNILTTEMRLLPISQITKRLGQNISSEIERATELLFNSSLIYIPPPSISNKLPSEDRQSTPHVQLFSTLMEKMLNESRRSEEKFEKLMQKMQEDREKADALTAKINQLNLDIAKKEQDVANEKHKNELDRVKQQMKNQEDALKMKLLIKEMEQKRELAERDHRDKMKKLEDDARREREAIRVIEPPRPRNPFEDLFKKKPSCLREGTLILMADFTEKPVELLEVGEMVLDHNLNPVRVAGVLEKFLLEDSFHGFDNETFFFTDTHQIVGRISGNAMQIYVRDLGKTIEENPLLTYLDVQELPERSEILHYDSESKKVVPEVVTVFTDPTEYPETTPVYIVLVESEVGTYFANGFVCRHEIPPLQYWPKTMSILFSLASQPDIKWIEDVPYNLQTVKKIDDIVEGGYLRLQEILKEGEAITTTTAAAPEGLSLSNQVISEIFDNPTFSAFAVGMYGKLGPILAEKLEVDESVFSKRLQLVVFDGLKEYFTNAVADAF